jgi:hypothetical protein
LLASWAPTLPCRRELDHWIKAFNCFEHPRFHVFVGWCAEEKSKQDGWVAEPNRGRKPNFVVLKQAKVLSTPSRAPESPRFLLVLSQFSYATLILLLPTIGRL